MQDKEVADKAKQVDALEQEVLAAKQEVAHQKTLVAALEEKARHATATATATLTLACC